MRIRYEDWNPGPSARATIAQAEAICRDYADQGFDLTLRQLYYQFVSRDLLDNTQRSYRRLGAVINRARLAGLLDWNYIVDRTRSLHGTTHWPAPGAMIASAADSYRLDKWTDQPRRVEVWVEKDALAGVIGRAVDAHDVDWFSCRGYVSQSELWSAAQRHLRYITGGQGVTVLHLGDHDPSGVDMTRDIRDRLHQFLDSDWLNHHSGQFATDPVPVAEIRAALREHVGGDPIEVRRIALNADQVRQYGPPPNPAKLTDSRASGYIAEHGRQSWELDALDPATLAALITAHIHTIRDAHAFTARAATEVRHRQLLQAASHRWDELVELLDDAGERSAHRAGEPGRRRTAGPDQPTPRHPTPATAHRQPAATPHQRRSQPPDRLPQPGPEPAQGRPCSPATAPARRPPASDRRGYRPGEYVDVTIHGARVRGQADTSPSPNTLTALIELPGTSGLAVELPIGTAIDTISIQRVPPAQWPPQPGDLWRDARGHLWCCLTDGHGAVRLCPILPQPQDNPAAAPDQLLAEAGPLSLDYRPAAQHRTH